MTTLNDEEMHVPTLRRLSLSVGSRLLIAKAVTAHTPLAKQVIKNPSFPFSPFAFSLPVLWRATDLYFGFVACPVLVGRR
jgi:hypothetical protein